MKQDYYKILGVSADSEDIVIRAAYRALMQKYHPDKHQGHAGEAERRAKEINEAYSVLGDPDRRAQFDRQRAEQRRRRATQTERPKDPWGDRPQSEPAREPPPRPEPEPATSTGAAATAVGLQFDPRFVVSAAAILIFFAAKAVLHGGAVGTTGVPQPAVIDTSGASANAAPTAEVSTGAMIKWNAGDDGDPKSYSAGALTVQLSSSKAKGDLPVPVLTVRGGDGKSFSVSSGPGFETAAAEFGVGRIDPDSEDGQVLFTTFSGGAHCCTDYKLLVRRKAAWSVVDLGSWDKGFTEFPADVDGDGVVDLVFGDDRFNYAFASYAESYAPPRVFNVRRARGTEVSWAPRYDALFEKDMAAAQKGCLERNNGACAAFVADAARLGRRSWAWEIMLQAYDRQSEWPVSERCTVVTTGECPDGNKLKFQSFPEELEWFLVGAGYIRPSDALFASSAPTSPSFDCAKVKSANLQLVCSTPQLAAADVELAFVYRKAVATAPDADALRREQQQWIRNRNNASADPEILLEMYRERTRALEGGA